MPKPESSTTSRSRRPFAILQLWARGAILLAAGLILFPKQPAPWRLLVISSSVLVAVGALLLAVGILAALGRLLDTKKATPAATQHPTASWLFSLMLAVILIGGSALVQPLSDRYVLAHADPAMVALADKAQMTPRTKLIFLRTRPQLDDDQAMARDCAQNVAANNSNGFIEQGCYDPTHNRIYIRKMPADLVDLEFTTAAYEVLHPIYIDLNNGSDAQNLNQAIEANYTAVADDALKSQVANFAKTEPDARDLELFSLLGTEYSPLSASLMHYYAPYFTDLSVIVQANKQIYSRFQTLEAQLSQLNQQIKHYSNSANAAYATSVSYAKAGNQANNDRFYAQYRQLLTAENQTINQYNKLLESYNTLVTEFNGSQPVTRLQSATGS